MGRYDGFFGRLIAMKTKEKEAAARVDTRRVEAKEKLFAHLTAKVSATGQNLNEETLYRSLFSSQPILESSCELLNMVSHNFFALPKGFELSRELTLGDLIDLMIET